MTTPDLVDLRSDTITQPTPAMRQAIAQAEVGDDVFGDDPTVHRLEARTAALLGKEAALFVPSGTMGNEIAVRAHTEPGDEILVDTDAHIYFYESGGVAALAGVMCRCLPGVRGVFGSEDVEAALRPRDVHFPPTCLVCLENTHNRGGGRIWPLPRMTAVAQTARRHGLKLHLDGARLWNASVASGVPEREYAARVDTVNVCFSKGLGAPVGSALAGPRDFIERARRFRKQFGGGMRQAGLLAAGALYALDHHRGRLEEDHANAQTLARGLAGLPGIALDPASVETNIVLFGTTGISAATLVERAAAAGVRVLQAGPQAIRAVTSLMVSSDHVDRALAVFRKLLTAG